MPDLAYLRREIEHMRAQIGRQRNEILTLQRAGISTASAEALLQRMLDKVDGLLPAARRVEESRDTSQQGQGLGRPQMVSH